MRQFFKQTGLHWALSNKTKLKEKMFVLSYVESQRHFLFVLSELCWGGGFLLFSMVFLPGSLTLSGLASGERYHSRIGGKAGLWKGGREPRGLTARGLSQQQTGRVGPVLTYLGRWCRNVPPAQGLGSAHCILALADAAASALAQEAVDAWSFVWWLQPGAFRGSLNLDTGPWVHKARPESLPGVDF